MRVRAILGSALAAFGILVVGWEVGAAGTATTHTSTPVTGSGGASSSGGTSGSTGSGSAGSGSSSSTSTGSAPASGPADGTYTGQTARTRFGDVQVEVTVSGGRITDVTALHLTDRDGRSVQISNRAAPILRDEVLKAQSASVSMVGGATYTSEGYLASLQSALDQAGF